MATLGLILGGVSLLPGRGKSMLGVDRYTGILTLPLMKRWRKLLGYSSGKKLVLYIQSWILTSENVAR